MKNSNNVLFLLYCRNEHYGHVKATNLDPDPGPLILDPGPGSWTQTLDPDPKNLDPENIDPEKHGP